ncbi:MAG: hypothetical protein GYA17_00540, partial [Chloroflexi bacterium]|nr:hypothetical protein [Chloroflexota bacterium]
MKPPEEEKNAQEDPRPEDKNIPAQDEPQSPGDRLRRMLASNSEEEQPEESWPAEPPAPESQTTGEVGGGWYAAGELEEPAQPEAPGKPSDRPGSWRDEDQYHTNLPSDEAPTMASPVGEPPAADPNETRVLPPDEALTRATPVEAPKDPNATRILPADTGGQ